ncbi:histidine kinase [Flavobacterium sp.]|uniref:tetratricopeptide repeat-containing sensor histidine kinase n=1 Tax=Flavobacterium sp. TaxID=239 RepID=UPI0039E22DCA
MKPFFILFRWVAFGLIVLGGFPAVAQVKQGDVFRQKVDSLNRIAFDQPVSVLRSADSMVKMALHNQRYGDYALLLQVQGVAETSLGNNTKALSLHMKSYRVFDSIHNNGGKILALINIGTVYMNIENIGKSKQYLLKALSLTQKGDYNYLKTIYVNLGVAMTYEDDFDKAIGYYLKAIPYLEYWKDENGLTINYHNIAACYTEMGKLDQAIAYELKAYAHYQKSGSTSSLAMITLELGKLYTDKGQLDKAKKFLDIGGKAAHDVQSPYYRDTFYEYLAYWYKESGQYEQSTEYLQKLMVLRDSIHSDETRENNAMLENQFQSSLQAKELELLRVQKKLDAAKIEQNNIWRMVFAVFAVFCLALIFILYRNYKLKQKANRLLNQKNDALTEQNLRLENENILVQYETLKNQVSPHFLFNSLNALASLISTDPQKAVKFTNAFSKIFRNTLERKDRHLLKLSEELQHVNAYLSLQKMRFGDNLITDIAVPSDRLADYLPPFSLQMVVENAIKHNSISSSEPLTIHIRVKGDFLVVTNNLQPRQFVEDSTGTGVENIRSRYKYVTELEPVFEIRNQEYYVQLPLIQEE